MEKSSAWSGRSVRQPLLWPQAKMTGWGGRGLWRRVVASRSGAQRFPALLKGRCSVVMIHGIWTVWLCSEQGSEK